MARLSRIPEVLALSLLLVGCTAEWDPPRPPPEGAATTEKVSQSLQKESESVFGSDGIYAVEPDGADGFYVGGTDARLFHLDSQGRTSDWSPFLSYASGPASVKFLKIYNNTLYVVGVFTEVDGQARNGTAAFDLTTGTLTSWNPGSSNLQ